MRQRFIVLAVLLWLQLHGVGAQTPPVLQSRIDQAQTGDSIMVLTGIYEGNIILSKRVSLIGSGVPVIRGNGKGSCITVTADSCVIKGLVVEHCGGNLMNDDSGIFLDSKHNRVEDNELRDILFGIYLFHADSNVIVGNRIHGRDTLELGQRGSGIHIWNSNYNVFASNTIARARDGFYIQYAKHTLIEGNEAYELRYGLHYMYADSNAFLRNSFHDNVAGAAIMYSKSIRFRHNVFIHNRGYSSFGILFQDCHAMLADSNVIADNVVGMFFEATTGNIFRHNVVAQNDVALQMFQNSTNNTITGNNFVDNLSPLSLVGRQTESHWSEGHAGNYWSSYDGYDLDGDGIGDVPAKIQNVFQYLEGQNPNLRLYLYSPASQALAAAAEAFPTIEINSEQDPYPLMRPVDVGSLPAVRMVAKMDRRATGDIHLLQAVPVVGIFCVVLMVRRLSRRGRP
jgi:nitrous oxidase accessory protein